mmetsp:Transcript_28351/g.62775  ORF Transcript_28351/g.62775 Transcript_28351/m.62775 type:complete len:440 (+) Transcript_28351:67-1386(+)
MGEAPPVVTGSRNCLQIAFAMMTALGMGYTFGSENLLTKVPVLVRARAATVYDSISKVVPGATACAVQNGSSTTGKGPKPFGPIIWLHVPKAGSMFETALVHYACEDRVPPGYKLLEAMDLSIFRLKYRDWHIETNMSCTFNGKSFPQGSKNQFPCSTARWQAACGREKFYHFQSGHYPLWRLPGALPRSPGQALGTPFGTIAKVNDGHLSQVVVLLRDPPQRTVSGWLADKHSCTKATNIMDYQRCVSSCHTQMLIGVWCGFMEPQGFPTKHELLGIPPGIAVELAMTRLEKVGFFGLTDEWDETVCLFHAMYGGASCVEAEFIRGRPGKARNASERYDLKAYGITRYVPGLDDRLYRHAVKLFHERLAEYDLTLRACAAQICPRAKSHLQDVLSGAGTRQETFGAYRPPRPVLDKRTPQRGTARAQLPVSRARPALQ